MVTVMPPTGSSVSVPHPVKARYYNLRCQADLDEQRFLLTFRLMRQEQGASSIKN
jgi:hypothetical protein